MKSAAALPRPSTRRRPLLFASMASGLLMLVVPALESLDPVERGSLPVLAKIPAFELVDHSSLPFGSKELHGHAVVANFIFTRCPTACPSLTRRMAEFQERTAHLDKTRLLSFTIDPEHDTAEVLSRYATRFGAGPRWKFVTGPLDAVKKAVKEGLQVRMGDVSAAVDLASVLHGTRFVLIDRGGRIRGYYDVSSDATFDKLVRDFEALAN